MNKDFGSVIVKEDIDFTVVFKYLLNSWYILVIALFAGSLLGWFYGNSRTPLYEMQATVSIPESWKTVAQYPDSVMFQLVKQYLAKQGSTASVMWISRPVDGTGNTMNALVAIDLKTSSLEVGNKQFSDILAGLRSEDSVMQVLKSAKSNSDNRKQQLLVAKGAFVKNTLSSASNYAETMKKYEDEIAQLASVSTSTDAIKWLTEPGIIAASYPKSATTYAVLGAVALFAVTSLVILFPGLKKNS